MSKFHIDKNGNPAICNAKTRPCPLGGDNVHFESKEKAQAYVDKKREKKHGLLPGVSQDKELGFDETVNDYMEEVREREERDLGIPSEQEIPKYKPSKSPVTREKRVHRYVVYKQSKYHYNIDDYDVSIAEFQKNGMAEEFGTSDFLSPDYESEEKNYMGTAQIEIGRGNKYSTTEFVGDGNLEEDIEDFDTALDSIKDYLNHQSGEKNLYVVRKSPYNFEKPFKDNAFKE